MRTGWVCGGLLGLCFFLLVFGAAILDPQYIGWLLQGNNQDSVQHLVGWEFFRSEPWHFPPGLIQNYGYPVSTSIVYTDSIPLFALIFKCLAACLPANFQYYGWWFALCYFLQGLFGWMIAEEISQETWVKILVTGFFLLSPVMLNRTIEHQALAAQWVLLAGIVLYLKPCRPVMRYSWLMLNIATVLIHAYLALMVLLLWAAYLYKNVFMTGKLMKRAAMAEVIINTMVLLLSGWLAGYFVVSLSQGIEAGGYNMDSMNLLAPFVPGSGSPVLSAHWSRFIKPLQGLQVAQVDEGFNYFGLGMLLLLVLSLSCFSRKMPDRRTLSAWLPLILVCSLLVIYALSNMIALGPWLIFQYPLSTSMLIVGDIFRASGRFFWPMYYLTMTGVFYILHQRLNRAVFITLVGSALLIQAADLSLKLKEINQYFTRVQAVTSTLDTPFWKEAGGRYTKMVFLPHMKQPQAKIPHFQDYIHYAAQHGMKVNIGYFAREDTRLLYAANKKVFLEAVRGRLAGDTIYIVTKPQIANILRGRMQGGDRIEKIGHFSMIVPGDMDLKS